MPTKVEQALIDANAIVARAMPLIELAGIGVRATIALLRKNGMEAEAKVFEDEYNAAIAKRGNLGAAIAEFDAKYGLPEKTTNAG